MTRFVFASHTVLVFYFGQFSSSKRVSQGMNFIISDSMLGRDSKGVIIIECRVLNSKEMEAFWSSVATSNKRNKRKLKMVLGFKARVAFWARLVQQEKEEKEIKGSV